MFFTPNDTPESCVVVPFPDACLDLAKWMGGRVQPSRPRPPRSPRSRPVAAVLRSSWQPPPPGGGHPGCFIPELLYATLQWAQTGLRTAFQVGVSLSLDKYPEVGWLGHRAILFLIFWGPSILVSPGAAPVCIPTNGARGIPFLHVLAGTCCLLIYWWGPFWQVWDVTHCG